MTVRSLGRRGLTVAALESASSANVPAFSSRWCRQEFASEAALATPDYLGYVDRLLERVRVGVLMPSHDGTIELLRRHRAQLESRTRLALAGESAISVAVNKERTLAVAKRLGIAAPRGVVVGSVGDLPAALREIGLPAVVKPTESWTWNGHGDGVRVAPQLVTNPREACCVVDTLTAHGHAILLQQLLSGRREAVSFLFAGGEVHARFAQWAKRTGPPLGGESVLRQSIDMPPDTGDQAERLIREIDLEGYSEVEFRRDSEGVPHLMEINPRLSASVEIAVRCGVDFPYLLYQWASGEPIDRVNGYRAGVWMRYLKGDITTTIASFQQRGRPGVAKPAQAVLDFGLSFFKPMGYDYVDWTDLLPAVKATTNFTRGAVKAFLHGKTGFPVVQR